jgi:hypothetical protein
MVVIKIAEEQKDILINTEFSKDSFFNPIQDKNDNWIISIEEYNACLECKSCIKEHPWIVDCEHIEYEPKEVDIIMFKK